MAKVLLQIYEYLKVHRLCGILSFLLFTLCLVISILHLNYKEDISDFLPLGDKHQQSLQVYQDISGANRLFIIFQFGDSTENNPDILVESIESFTMDLQQRDSLHMVRNLVTQIDWSQMSEITDFIYENIPYFLTNEDYIRIDSILNDENFVRTQLQQDKQMLMFPTGGLLSSNIQRDPLNLFTPVFSRLPNRGTDISYELYDGYIFSSDMKRGIVMMESPFGNSETENNGKLLNLVNKSVEMVQSEFPGVIAHVFGGPAIAVGNASQIKTDCMVSVSISVFLILLLLYLSFRSIWNMLLIVVSIGWGWLFAMGGLALVHDNMSVIVIGISSVILGIAVNYPLHLIAHLSHTTNIRSALKEIVMPLVVGNITTVGAFLSLVPLRSVALRDLGLFSSFLLIGTILFVVLYLPHVVRVYQNNGEHLLFRQLGELRLENRKWLVATVVFLTLFFGYFSLQTKFDSSFSNINYMDEGQIADMEYFQENMMPSSYIGQDVYIVSTDNSLEKALKHNLLLENALDKYEFKNSVLSISSCSMFLPTEELQKSRLSNWHHFIGNWRNKLKVDLLSEARNEGFVDGTFDDFINILNNEYRTKSIEDFNVLFPVFASNLSVDSINGKYSVVDVISVNPDSLVHFESYMETVSSNANVFDLPALNSTIANNLSDNFNYIGWACGLIVFFFLWFSLGSLELAILSFLPMTISWIWILGIMALLDIQFNIVNVILATFIFGQGDDYTIFMTEGSCYEYAYRKKMLLSYKNSIILSALIMFIGIGSLIFAKHPALHSLAEVTIVGMFSVVLMAYLFPPLIYKWLVMDKGEYRRQPLTLRYLYRRYIRQSISHDAYFDALCLLKDRYMYKGVEIYSSVKSNLNKYDNYKPYIDVLIDKPKVVVLNCQKGELPILLAMLNPSVSVIGVDLDEDNRLITKYTAEGIASNLTVTSELDETLSELDTKLFMIKPTAEVFNKYKRYNPIIIN